MTPNDLFRVGGPIDQLKMISLFTEISNINDQTKSRKLKLIPEIYVLDSVRPRFSLFLILLAKGVRRARAEFLQITKLHASTRAMRAHVEKPAWCDCTRVAEHWIKGFDYSH